MGMLAWSPVDKQQQQYRNDARMDLQHTEIS